MREDGQGALRGTDLEVYRGLSGESAGFDVVVGDSRERCIRVLRVSLAQRLGDTEVELRALLSVECLVERLAHEGVGEPIGRGVGLGEEPGLDGRREERFELRRPLVLQLLSVGHRELAAEDGEPSKRRGGLRRQALDPLRDDGGDLRRERELTRRGVGP